MDKQVSLVDWYKYTIIYNTIPHIFQLGYREGSDSLVIQSREMEGPFRRKAVIWFGWVGDGTDGG